MGVGIHHTSSAYNNGCFANMQNSSYGIHSFIIRWKSVPSFFHISIQYQTFCLENNFIRFFVYFDKISKHSTITLLMKVLVEFSFH